MTYLTRAQILAADDLKTETLDVEDWGGPVCIRALSVAELSGWYAGLNNEKTVSGFGVMLIRLVALSIVNENGERIFAENDVAELHTKSAKALTQVCGGVMKLNGIEMKTSGSQGVSDKAPVQQGDSEIIETPHLS